MYPFTPCAAASPPTAPPRPNPAFVQTRETAVARWRCCPPRQGHEQRRLRRAERPVPDPAHGRGRERGSSGVRANAGPRSRRRAPPRRRRGRARPETIDQLARERRGHDRGTGQRADDEAGSAKAEPSPVVQVDHFEREHGAPAEGVQEDPDLDEPQLTGKPVAKFVTIQTHV